MRIRISHLKLNFCFTSCYVTGCLRTRLHVEWLSLFCDLLVVHKFTVAPPSKYWKMYSTKTIHKYVNPNYPQVYNTIGDPYKGTREELPDRWKNKQFVTQRCPKNSGNGFFIQLQYHSEPYIDLGEKYCKTQPLEKRKLGFGSHDAYKSGEFTSTKATDRYRSLVKQETSMMDKNRDIEKERRLIQKYKSQKWVVPKNREGNNLNFPSYMYDVGRTNVTPFSPKSSRDSFYELPKHAAVDPKLKGKDNLRRLGTHRPMSATVGEMAWKFNYTKPQYGNTNTIDKFFDKGHLSCKGF